MKLGISKIEKNRENFLIQILHQKWFSSFICVLNMINKVKDQMLDSLIYAIGILSAHMCLLKSLYFAKAPSHTKCIEINEHGKNIPALQFTWFSWGFLFFLFTWCCKPENRGKKCYLIKWSSTGKLIYFSVRIRRVCQNSK